MTWRLLTYETYDAATNMAIDEAILEAHLAGLVPPTLRLYGFSPPAVSIGYSQQLPEYLVSSIYNQGFALVRRPTGGRAVLHLGDLTYSLVGSIAQKQQTHKQINGQEFLSSSIGEAYQQICSALQIAFASLGISVGFGSACVAYQQHHDCFLSSTRADLVFQDKKLVGSAQLRRRRVILQHGSILLNQKQSLMSELLAVTALANDSQVAHHANLFDILGKELALEKIAEAIQIGFEQVFNVTFEIGALTNFEREKVSALKEQYSLPVRVPLA